MEYLLPILLALAIFGAIVCALVPRPSHAKAVALIFSLACVGVFIPLLVNFNYSNPAPQFVYSFGAVHEIGFSLTVGVDSISLWLIALTVFLQPLVIAASFTGIQERQREYYGWMMGLLAAMTGVFMARDLLLFYAFFELTLIPMFFIIGIWGGPQRRYAAGKFFLFTFSGSVFTLAAAIYLGLRAGTFDISQAIAFAQKSMTSREVFWIVLGFLAGFAVKVPLFPVHTWLPLAHTEAPTAGSVILAGILLKLGTYGIFRFALPIGFIHAGAATPILFPVMIKTIAALCIVGIIYGALVAWVQQDIKKLVAYSSVSHLGFCVLGLAALNYEGVQGSVLYMINHGLSTGAMFLVIGMIYERYHTRDVNVLSGLAKKMPVMSFFFVFFVLSSIGLPGLNGFVSEFLTILGAFKSEHLGVVFGSFAAVGVILGAVYMLYMTARVIFGPLKLPAHGEGGHHAQPDQGQAASPGHEASVSTLPQDLSPREIGVLVPIALAVVTIGVIPARLLDTFYPPIQAVLQGTPAAVTLVEQPPAPAAVPVPPQPGPERSF